MRDVIAHSLRHGVRALRRSPGSSLVIIATLAGAIGAGVAVFSVLHATLLQPPPLRDPDRVFFIQHAYGEGAGAASPPLLIDHRTRTQSFESLSAAMPWNAALTGAGDPERLRGMQVSADFFSTFGVDAARGRVFRPDEDQPGHERVVVISDGLWERRFGRRADAVGSTLQLNGEPYEVVGVMPPTFQWGRAYGRDGVSELWAPFALTPVRLAENQRGNEFLDVYGRLRPTSSQAQAQAELDKEVLDLRARYAGRYTAASGFSLRLVPIRDEAIGHLRQMLVAVFVAVVSLLLVAATNVAGLLIARASGRHREMSVHAALGAGRGRLVAQNFGEAAVLAAVSGASGPGAGLAGGVRPRPHRSRHASALLSDCPRSAGRGLCHRADRARGDPRRRAAVVAGIPERLVHVAAHQPAERRGAYVARRAAAHHRADGDDAGACWSAPDWSCAAWPG